MSEEIRAAQERIREEVIPTAKKLEATARHMRGATRTAANYLLMAKKGIEEHVLPHLQEAIAVKPDLNRTGIHLTTQPEDIKTATHAIMGDIPLYTEVIEPEMTKIQKGAARASIEVNAMSYFITENTLEALKILEESLEEASDAAFKRAEDIENNDLPSIHTTIAALEEFEL